MNPEDIKARIQFSSKPITPHEMVFTGTFSLSESLYVDTIRLKMSPSFLKTIHEKIVSKIVGRIYDDQRGDMFEAIHRLTTCNPLDFQAQAEARNEIMRLARHQ